MREPQFPPLLNGHLVVAGDDPVAAAMERAVAGQAGAGDLFWLADDATARCAVMLEPEVDAAYALCMIPLAMVAAADALGAIGEANLAITHKWPADLLANGAVVGGFDMRFPEGIGPADRPDFAILSLEAAVRWPGTPGFEPGERGDRTVLHEEGCGSVDTAGLLESWARHFLTWIDTWEDQGFAPVGRNWLFRAHGLDSTVSIDVGGQTIRGDFAGIDERGGALIRQDSGMRLIALEEIWLRAKEPSP